jgi:lysophospholipase L1-like esterase
MASPMAGAGGMTGGVGGSGGQTPPTGGGGAGGSTDPMSGGGSGGSGGGGGSGGSDSDAEIPMDEFVSPCADEDIDVAMLGDSYVNWITHDFPGDMRAKAGKQWSLYAVGATSMATGGVGRIPDQLPMATGDNPNLKAIIMTGGGNDILVADTVMFPDATMCTSVENAPEIEDCQKIVAAAIEVAISLMDDTADAGVKDIVYFFYPHIPGGGLISGPTPNAILDYALPRAKDACDSSLERTGGRMRCTFVDMVPVFEGKTGLFADDFSEAGDGVHPNFEGSKAMAEEIWSVMQDKCIGQPSSSGCCAAATP